MLLTRCRSRHRSRAHVLMSQRPAAAEWLRTSCAGSARFRPAKEPAGGTQRERGARPTWVSRPVEDQLPSHKRRRVALGTMPGVCARRKTSAPRSTVPIPVRTRLSGFWKYLAGTLGQHGIPNKLGYRQDRARSSSSLSLSLFLSPSLTLEASTARSCPWNERRFLFGEAGVKKDIMLSTKGWTPSLVALRGGLPP